MSYSMALTLGHNSSAILISPNGKILAGYETERFDQVKSSSRFPIKPIEQMLFDYGLDYGDITAYVGHWFTSGNLPSESTKHCDLEVLSKFQDVHSLNQDLTHHDSHLESAMIFAGFDFYADDTYAFVMDGFGTMGECISIYKTNPFGYTLKKRVFGYNNSLGLLYQYATDFMGMKMNNHEYKILAYEVHIDDIDCRKDVLTAAAYSYAKELLESYFSGGFVKDEDPIVNVSALLETQARIQKFLYETMSNADVNTGDQYAKRVATAYLIQLIVEIVVLELRKYYPSSNLLLAGGLFYNVKLNNLLANTCNGKFCVMPLSGDQGAGLGVYQAHVGNLSWPDHVFWGTRHFDSIESGNGITVVESMLDALPIIQYELERIGFVNLVRGAMEFGPRALCNTSTLALPTAKIAMTINEINDRTAEMPMAPVMTRYQAETTFKDVDKIHKSLEYMILTRDYNNNEFAAAKMLGAAHYYPDRDVFTGRPQITNDPYITRILETNGPLINTSFNFHGFPIVFKGDSLKTTHFAQRNIRPDLDLKTVIVKDKK